MKHDGETKVVLTTGPQGFHFIDLDGKFVRELEPMDLNQDLWEAMNELVADLYVTVIEQQDHLMQTDNLYRTEPSVN